MLPCKDAVVAQLSPSAAGLVTMAALIPPVVLLCQDSAVAQLSPSAAGLITMAT